jgi:hypothetical protein
MRHAVILNEVKYLSEGRRIAMDHDEMLPFCQHDKAFVETFEYHVMLNGVKHLNEYQWDRTA